MSIKDYSKEELELFSQKDITNILLTEMGKTNTATLYKQIIKLLGLPASYFDTKIGDYYTMIATDKRFVLLEDGDWDLKSKHSSKNKLIIMDDEDDEFDESKDDEDLIIESEDEFDKKASNDDEFEDDEDDLKDLVILDEDELELEA